MLSEKDASYHKTPDRTFIAGLVTNRALVPWVLRTEAEP
jgi:hypothetical protein